MKDNIIWRNMTKTLNLIFTGETWITDENSQYYDFKEWFLRDAYNTMNHPELKYDVYTFGLGPKNKFCDHKNASCSFEIGPDCYCKNCEATW